MASPGLRNRPVSRAQPLAADAASLAQRYRQVRAATLALVEPLAPEDFVVQSMPDTSPAKWHLAHTSWFFEEFVLQSAVDHFRPYHEQFRYLFNSYYNSVGPMHSRPHRGLLSRPTVADVRSYRAHVDEQMYALLERTPLDTELLQIITLGLHHEQQHQELLLTDLKHLFGSNPLLPAYADHSVSTACGAPALSFKAFDGGLKEMGHAGDSFCFDNELPRHRTYVEPFRLANRAVTNAEFLEFIRAGGYRNAQCWLSDGWATVQLHGWEQPLYWTPSLEHEFTLTGLREIDLHAPVCHISYYEADAFARWAGSRLPTEAEWELAASEVPLHGNFVENAIWQPLPATYPTPTPDSDTPMLQMLGDVWEWTQSAYASYPGFKPLRGALGEYNGKFMVNQLVLRGGSCATPASHIRITYRNFFNPAARWQFSGLRLARSI
jgi:ergothioneine biosynthesis protein EgtB